MMVRYPLIFDWQTCPFQKANEGGAIGIRSETKSTRGTFCH